MQPHAAAFGWMPSAWRRNSLNIIVSPTWADELLCSWDRILAVSTSGTSKSCMARVGVKSMRPPSWVGTDTPSAIMRVAATGNELSAMASCSMPMRFTLRTLARMWGRSQPGNGSPVGASQVTARGMM